MRKCLFFVTDRQTQIVFMDLGWFADTFREQHGSQLALLRKFQHFVTNKAPQLTILRKFQHFQIFRSNLTNQQNAMPISMKIRKWLSYRYEHVNELLNMATVRFSNLF